MEQYHKPEIGNDVSYMIDKVARLRVLQGKFGIDYSEILNFEEEMANKPRTDHMNYLVYKTQGSQSNLNTSETLSKYGYNKENFTNIMPGQTLLQNLEN